MIIIIVGSIINSIDTLLKINKLNTFNKQEIVNLIYEIIVWHYDSYILDDLDNKKIINDKFNIQKMRSTFIDQPLIIDSIENTSTETDSNLSSMSLDPDNQKINFTKESKPLPNIHLVNNDIRKVKINDNPLNFRSWLYN